MTSCVKIVPSNLKGRISIPPSKSLSHRAIIAASLGWGISRLDNIIFSDDIGVTIQAMEKFGAKIDKISEACLSIEGSYPRGLKNEEIYCGESGSTLRFLIPVSLVGPTKAIFTGEGRLVNRPLNPYYNIFDKQEISYRTNDGQLPLEICGQLNPGQFEVEGNISSQFITGLLFALPLLKADSSIKIIGNLESRGYVELTIDILRKFGIQIASKQDGEFFIKGNQTYNKTDYSIEGDFSQAAFWLVAGILGEEIETVGLNMDSLQGDRSIIDLIRGVGGELTIDGNSIIGKKSKTKNILVDVSQFPDLVPILAVLASLSEGETKIINAGRLRIKESDRLKAISKELNKLGAQVKEGENSLTISGREYLQGGEVDSWNDHRIAMALAIASIKCREEVIIRNSHVVKKSYPGFWEDFKSLGGKIHEFNMGE